MKRTHIPFYETYEDAKNRDESKLHYFKVVAKTIYKNWYDFIPETVYLLADEDEHSSKQFVAFYDADAQKFCVHHLTVQQFLNLKYDNDMHRLLASVH